MSPLNYVFEHLNYVDSKLLKVKWIDNARNGELLENLKRKTKLMVKLCLEKRQTCDTWSKSRNTKEEKLKKLINMEYFLDMEYVKYAELKMLPVIDEAGGLLQTNLQTNHERRKIYYCSLTYWISVNSNLLEHVNASRFISWI